MDEAPQSDADLVARACNGEAEAFGVLVSRYEGLVYNAVVHLVGSREDAEDIAQDVFLNAFRGLGGFRRKAKFSTWLYGIMLNRVRTHWRSGMRHKGVVSLNQGNPGNEAQADPPSPRDGPVARSMRAETVEMVRGAIEGLEADLREIVVLRDIEGLSYDEMSQVLGLPLGTVKSRLFRARSVLKDRVAPLWAHGV